MASEILFVVRVSADGRYQAKAADHSISAEAESYEDVKVAVREAVRYHFFADERPELIRLRLVKEEVICP